MTAIVTHPIVRLLRKPCLRVVGANSGTSIDGLDLALVEIVSRRPTPRVRFVAGRHHAYPVWLRRELAEAASADRIDKERVSRLHFAYGGFVGRRIQTFLRGEPPVDLIGVHGQTIGHFPEWRTGALGRHRATWQIGAPSAVAQQTGIATVGDFRTGDVAASGMGAPLSGYYHHILFGPGVAVLNIGGIANLSISTIRRARVHVTAFDVGPGNMLLDALAWRLLRRSFDRFGREASSGTPVARIVARSLRDPYFRRKPPKTCGREQFGDAKLERWFFKDGRPVAAAVDLLATAVEITARSIADAVSRWISPLCAQQQIVAAGGGIKNRALMRRLQTLLPGWRFLDTGQWNVPEQFVEPTGFAILANETLRGRPGNVGLATGAKRPAILGVIALPYFER